MAGANEKMATRGPEQSLLQSSATPRS
jgi:hypothetical protein